MKAIILVLSLVAIASAIPKPSKLHFRNVYKEPLTLVKEAPKPRIIGGQEADINQIPYQVFLEFNDGYKGWYCGGSLISANYVLTAGHCGHYAIEVYATLGAHRALKYEDSQVTILSRNITVHPEWNSELLVNDLSIIHLPKSVKFTEAIAPVTLPRRNTSSDLTGETARISGWGLIDGYADDISKVLNYVDVTVISNDECATRFTLFDDLASSIVCTSGNQNTGVCNGDSGGPLTINDVQVGIVSFVVKYCPAGYPSGFTRVTSFLDWIEEHSDVVIL